MSSLMVEQHHVLFRDRLKVNPRRSGTFIVVVDEVNVTVDRTENDCRVDPIASAGVTSIAAKRDDSPSAHKPDETGTERPEIKENERALAQPMIQSARSRYPFAVHYQTMRVTGRVDRPSFESETSLHEIARYQETAHTASSRPRASIRISSSDVQRSPESNDLPTVERKWFPHGTREELVESLASLLRRYQGVLSRHLQRLRILPNVRKLTASMTGKDMSSLEESQGKPREDTTTTPDP
ncbi:hypothetical protein K469DRAFT_683951 [Zopfia rhizophila CBS 207.26]|uniref:Uncharacterized protein n=1 Tax=Zopfia rhizophila CBS 207.26 TaxID=1314779 RepID=A0A6A6DA54_9PEZI|nr:hypothetical protein K469DRAFT_683951 [Zopfia rhizophila CBS 207.26]